MPFTHRVVAAAVAIAALTASTAQPAMATGAFTVNYGWTVIDNGALGQGGGDTYASTCLWGAHFPGGAMNSWTEGHAVAAQDGT